MLTHNILSFVFHSNFIFEPSCLQNYHYYCLSEQTLMRMRHDLKLILYVDFGPECSYHPRLGFLKYL